MKGTLLYAGLIAVWLVSPARGQSSRSIPNFSAANLVLGDTDFRGGGGGGTSASELVNGLTGDVAIDPTTRKVFVADGLRVLRFASAAALTNGADAEAVFGQGSFTSFTTSSAPNEFRFGVVGIFVDVNGRLWVADINNRRVLRFDNASAAGNFPAAARVYGQQNFTTNSVGFDAKGMAGPTDVVVDSNDRLWVADANNNRVLRFDGISSKPSGASADAVLGQPTLNPAGAGPDGLSQSAMDIPYSLAISAAGTLFVADRDNNRILRFNNAAGLPNGAGASAVLGQVQFNTESTDVIATKLNLPSGISIAADDTLWVADRYNQRVLRFDDASTKGNGAAADGVLGQPNFFTNQQNNNSQGAFSQNSQGLLFPEYLFVDDARGELWVSDSQNKRVLRFGAGAVAPGDTIRPEVAVAKYPKKTKSGKVTIKGSASDNVAVARVQYRLGKGAPVTASGTNLWSFKAKLKSGPNKISIEATDGAGNVSLMKTIKITRE